MKVASKVIVGIAIMFVVGFGFVFTQTNVFRRERLMLTHAVKQISYSTQDMMASVIYSNEKITVPLEFIKQEHSVTCELAALRMALNYFGSDVTEDELIARIPFDSKGPKTPDNIWGDPDRGFVGSVDGSIFLGTGYGVYEEPIRDLALSYRDAFIIENAKLTRVLQEANKGNPVIVWGLLSNKEIMEWNTKKGKKITAFPGEHARVVIGYSGTISNPSHIVMMDPIYGRIRMSRDKFLENWGALDNKAVVVY